MQILKYGENNSRAKASLARWVRRLSATINALKRKPEGPRRALDNNAAEPDRTAVVTVFASLESDGNLDFTNIPARPNPSLTITDDDGMKGAPTVNAPATGAPMITGMSALPPPAPCCERRPAPATSRSSAPAKAARTLLAFAALLATLAVAAPARAITLVTNTSSSTLGSVGLDSTEFAQGFMTGSNSTGYTATEIDIQIDSRTSTVPPTVTLVKLSPTGANPVTLQSPASITPNTVDIKVTYTAPVGTSLDASALYFVTITHSSNSSSAAPRVSRDQSDSETVESSGWSIDNAYKSRSKGGTTYTDEAQGYSALIAVRGTINTSSNNAPAFTDTTLMRNVAENTAADTNIGAAIPAAADVDGDTLTYTMEGTDAASFTFDATATTRQIKTKAALDFENKNSYSVTIKADDGNGGADTVDVTISVTNVDETPQDCNSGNSNEIWCVGLTAGAFGSLIGYASGVFGSIAESDTSFTYNGTNYTVSRFSEDLVAGYRSLTIYLSPVNSSTLLGDHRLIVHVGSSVISFGDFTLAGDNSYVTGITNALLSNGVTTTVKLIVNAPPTALNGTVTMDEDTEYAFAEVDFNYSDPESDALSSITIATLPANGALTLSGSAVSVNDEVTMVQLTNGDLKYAPPADANGDAYASFTFKVNDGKGDSAAAYTMTINVTALADPPAAPRGLTAEDGRRTGAAVLDGAVG